MLQLYHHHHQHASEVIHRQKKEPLRALFGDILFLQSCDKGVYISTSHSGEGRCKSSSSEPKSLSGFV